MRTVVLWNHTSMCGIRGFGRTYPAAMRDAVRLAGKHFMEYGDHSDRHTFEWWCLFFRACRLIKESGTARATASSPTGIAVECYRHI